ncbi:MAG: folylpolyglutamate synthase/dihydrofolate synthase family protein [Chthoniobacter sp.]|uniref:bifunctional folylpolyglutamate synthase/dihydrofolate synthase n=1 Tax=Chthoniobacter sp. TaxID=2510640 RepID=UPI0032A79A3B
MPSDFPPSTASPGPEDPAYRAALDWLYTFQLHGIQLGLDNMLRLCRIMDIHLDPTGRHPAWLHVAGTNGKGSVCAMLDAIYRTTGRRTAFYSSPHLNTIRERIRVDGTMIPVDAVTTGLGLVRRAATGWEEKLTFFEILTALALWWFQKQSPEVVVWEVGLGGRLDATNIVCPTVCVVTPIALDHQQYLGSTLEEIAGEKAGIFKAGVPVVSAAQSGPVAAALAGVAGQVGCLLHFASGEYEGPLSLAGRYQRRNAYLAEHAVKAAGDQRPDLAVSSAVRKQALAAVQWPGRFQFARPDLVLDGAHNPHAARELAVAWQEQFGTTQATLILCVMGDKDAVEIVRHLLPLSKRIIATGVNNPRTLPPGRLQQAITGLSPKTECLIASSIREAMKMAGGFPDPILVAGSLFLIGEATAFLDPRIVPDPPSMQ